ncbi:hypothetical protein [Mycoplasma sp. Mirounga ES2805-ORL]|uniref:hypothetical protein n=1 Tax=Mycoplasma sp. Mirounga ES2805-ORL TaxID=754514 RepID=UPI00197C105A|nr:hypothetical protein [Mycoplasma sp. Mirounga ES2805-ORL]QSF13522.1 hypothetical protein JXZ90_02490 [Mycoplasma sp. Mirounga ES2805-ORL]
MIKINQFKKYLKSDPNKLENYLKSASDKELVYIINYLYYPEIITKFKFLNGLNYIPSISALDIYNEFLSNSPEMARKYDSTKNATFKTYILLLADYYGKNYIRKYSRLKRCFTPLLIENYDNIEDKSNNNSIIDNIDIMLFLKHIKSNNNSLLKNIFNKEKMKFISSQKINLLRQSFQEKFNNFFLLINSK